MTRVWRRSTLLLTCAAAITGLGAAHAYVIRQGPDYTGLPLTLDHLLDLAATIGLVAICTALGRFTLNRVRIDFGALDNLLFGTAIGAGLLSTVLLALGLAGGCNPWIIGVVILAVAALSWRKLSGVPALVSEALRSMKPRGDERG
jgi:hypothetical protein